MNKTSTKQKSELKTKMNEAVDDEKNYLDEPGNNIINNILNYSKALSIRKSKSIENIELVLN